MPGAPSDDPLAIHRGSSCTKGHGAPPFQHTPHIARQCRSVVRMSSLRGALPPSANSPHCLMALIRCTAPTVGTLDLSSTHLCFVCLHSPPLRAKKSRDPSRCQWTTRRGTWRHRCCAGCLLHPVSRRSPPRPYLWPRAWGCPAEQPLGYTVSSKVSVSVRRPAKTDCQHLGLLLAR